MPYKDKQKQKECAARWQKNNADAHRQSVAKWDAKHRKFRTDRRKVWAAKNPHKVLLHCAKRRAKERGIEFNIDYSDVVIPDVCPVLNVKLEKRTVYAPSLDRIDNTKGYIKGNVWVISWRANQLKSSATLEELKLLVSALEKCRT